MSHGDMPTAARHRIYMAMGSAACIRHALSHSSVPSQNIRRLVDCKEVVPHLRVTTTSTQSNARAGAASRDPVGWLRHGHMLAPRLSHMQAPSIQVLECSELLPGPQICTRASSPRDLNRLNSRKNMLTYVNKVHQGPGSGAFGSAQVVVLPPCSWQ